MKGSRRVKLRKKVDFKYNLKLFKSKTFTLDLFPSIPGGFSTKIFGVLLNKISTPGVNVQMPNEFTVDEKLYPRVLPKIYKRWVLQVIEETKQEQPGFRIITCNIRNFSYIKNDNDNYDITINLYGDFTF